MLWSGAQCLILRHNPFSYHLAPLQINDVREVCSRRLCDTDQVPAVFPDFVQELFQQHDVGRLLHTKLTHEIFPAHVLRLQKRLGQLPVSNLRRKMKQRLSLRASFPRLLDDMSETFHHICPNATWCSRTLLDSLLELAVEIAREGREGRRVGTLFTMGFADIVLQNSRPLILDPLAAHPRHARHITDPNLRGTIKELAQLDGAFILDDTGTVLAACRYLDTSSKAVEMAFGLGSRHLAAASISKETNAIAIVVSESAVVRVFYEGHMQAEILPELWLLSRHSLHLRGPIQQHGSPDLRVFTTEETPSAEQNS